MWYKVDDPNVQIPKTSAETNLSWDSFPQKRISEILTFAFINESIVLVPCVQVNVKITSLFRHTLKT